MARQEKKFAFPLKDAILRDFMADLTEHIPVDIDMDQFEVPFKKALEERDYKKANDILVEIQGLPTKRNKSGNQERNRRHKTDEGWPICVPHGDTR